MMAIHTTIDYTLPFFAYLCHERLGCVLQRLVVKKTTQVKEEGGQDYVQLFTHGHRQVISISVCLIFSYNAQQLELCACIQIMSLYSLLQHSREASDSPAANRQPPVLMILWTIPADFGTAVSPML